MSARNSAKTSGKIPPNELSGGLFFTGRLIKWHHSSNNRQMPWKGEKDPYKIWLSEIILQQTRVAQGMEYYLRIVKTYPTIEQLAAAPDAAVFKLWEGLGYYSRCRNLLATARMVCKTYQGKFPSTYQQLLDLPGIGPYTAAAIASFAFQLPYAVVDGNVFRVLARYFGIYTPTDSTEGKKYFSELANQLLYQPAPGIYNQAIMDFGATICKPQQPLCAQCFLKTKCAARQSGWVHQLPVKEKTIQRSVRHFTYWVFDFQGKRAVRERPSGDIWQHLSEYYLMETDKPVEWDTQSVSEWLKGQGIRTFQLESISPLYQQSLTHQHIKGIFISIRVTAIPTFLQHYQWIPCNQLKARAFPRLINQWMEAPEMP